MGGRSAANDSGSWSGFENLVGYSLVKARENTATCERDSLKC